jgi:hypothetical protein
MMHRNVHLLHVYGLNPAKVTVPRAPPRNEPPPMYYFSFLGRAAPTSFHPPQGSVQPRVM